MLGLGHLQICLDQVCKVSEHVVCGLQELESWVVDFAVSEAFEEGRAVERDKLGGKLHGFHLLVGQGWRMADLKLISRGRVNLFFLFFLDELCMLDLVTQDLLEIFLFLFLDFLLYFFTHFDNYLTIFL